MERVDNIGYGDRIFIYKHTSMYIFIIMYDDLKCTKIKQKQKKIDM